MKKQISKLIIALCMMLCVSCTPYEYATTQTDVYVEASQYEVRTNVSFDIVIRYGVPYYYRGSILYYLYDNIYYYPYWYDDYWYVRAYTRPFDHINYRPYFRPSRNDYRFRPGIYHGYGIPNHRHYNRPPTHRPDRVNPGHHHSHSNMNRPPQHKPDNMNRSPQHRPNGHMNRSPQNRPHNSSPRMGGRR
jgi:hypothetical protein